MTIEEMKRKKLEKGYSCHQIAELSGVPFGTVQKIFSGITKKPRYETLKQLESVLKESESKDSYSESLRALTKASMIREERVYQVEKQQGEYTLEDYYAMPDERRVELIDGVIYDMSAPTTIHQQLCGEISFAIQSYIRKKNGDCIVFMAPTDVQLDCDDKTMLQPDVFVICQREKLLRRCLYGAPDLVIEILSPSTRKKDMNLKYTKYANAGVREYWIVDPDRQKVMVYDLEHEEFPVVYGFDNSILVRIFDGECEVDFAQIYDKLKFLYEHEM